MVKNYDPVEILVSVGGVSISGFAPDTFVSATRDNPVFSKVVGADGEVCRVRSRSKTGTIKLTLLSTSVSNDVLTAFVLVDEATGAGVIPILIKDNLGTTTMLGGEGWVEGYADVAFGKEGGTREWSIGIAEFSPFVGGVSA